MAQRAGRSLHRRQGRVLPGLNDALCEAVRAITRDAVNRDERNAQRAHLLQVCKQTGKTPEELGFSLQEETTPAVPENGEYLWEWFQELSSGRGNNGFGVLPLSWADMAAWARMTGNQPEPWETMILRSMDGAFLAAWKEAAATRPLKAEKSHD